MLRLLVLLVALVGLLSLIPSTPSASALPPDRAELDCLGLLHSALVRSGSTLLARDRQTGEDIVLDSNTNPGDFRGAAGVGDLLALFPRLAQNGCALPLPNLISCIDFSTDDPCYPGDTDSDSYLDYLELRLGSDLNDASSTPEYALRDEQTGSIACSDHLDNDLDGRADNGDSGCRLTCDDFRDGDRCSDSDGDGWLKYVEEMWGSDPDDVSSTPEDIGDCIDFDNGLDCAPF